VRQEPELSWKERNLEGHVPEVSTNDRSIKKVSNHAGNRIDDED